MATQVYVNLMEDQNQMNLDKYRVEQPHIRIYLPRVEEISTNNQRHLTQHVENNNNQERIQHATYRQNQKGKSMERKNHQEIDNRIWEKAQDSRSQYDVYKRSEDDIYIKYQDFCSDLNSTGDMGRSRDTPKQDRNNNSKIIKVTIENIRTLPPSGKMEILLELPSGFQDATQNKMASLETDVQSTTHVPSISNSASQSPKRKSCTCRNLAGSLFDALSSSNHLGVPEMRPRSNSDSKLQFRRSHPLSTQQSVPPGKMDGPEKRQIDVPVPEIKVQDFSERRKYLQTRLEHESEELKKDLIDNADFISQVNQFRKRSNTCPDQILRKSPIPMKSRDDNRKDRDKKVKNVVKTLSLQQPPFAPHHLLKVVE